MSGDLKDRHGVYFRYQDYAGFRLDRRNGLGCDTPQFEILVAFATSVSSRIGTSSIEGGF